MRKNKSKKYPGDLGHIKAEDIKFYSEYCSPNDWTIMTAEERDSCMKDISVRENGQLDYYRFMFPHTTFSDAKSRISMNIKCEACQIKLGKMRIQSLRASDFTKSQNGHRKPPRKK